MLADCLLRVGGRVRCEEALALALRCLDTNINIGGSVGNRQACEALVERAKKAAGEVGASPVD